MNKYKITFYYNLDSDVVYRDNGLLYNTEFVRAKSEEEAKSEFKITHKDTQIVDIERVYGDVMDRSWD